MLTATYNFWTDPGIGPILATFLGVLGILVVIFAIINVIKHVAKGEVGKAVKGVIGSVLLAAFLFQPQLASAAINAGGAVVSKVIDTVSSIAGNGTTPTTPPTPATGGN